MFDGLFRGKSKIQSKLLLIEKLPAPHDDDGEFVTCVVLVNSDLMGDAEWLFKSFLSDDTHEQGDRCGHHNDFRDWLCPDHAVETECVIEQ